MAILKREKTLQCGSQGTATFDTTTGQSTVLQNGKVIFEEPTTLAAWDKSYPRSKGWEGSDVVDDNTSRSGTNELLILAAKAGWQPEQQAVWLNEWGSESWDTVDEETKLMVCHYLHWFLNMFGIGPKDHNSKLLVTVFR